MWLDLVHFLMLIQCIAHASIFHTCWSFWQRCKRQSIFLLQQRKFEPNALKSCFNIKFSVCFFRCLPVLSSHNRTDLSRPFLSADNRIVPVGSNFNSVTGAVWPTKTNLQLPVIRSQIKMRASSKPAITQAFVCEMDNETVLHDGFHFLNSVPLCKSYTTMKFGAGSFNSFVTTHTYDPSCVIALSDVIKSWCGIRKS